MTTFQYSLLDEMACMYRACCLDAVSVSSTVVMLLAPAQRSVLCLGQTNHHNSIPDRDRKLPTLSVSRPRPIGLRSMPFCSWSGKAFSTLRFVSS